MLSITYIPVVNEGFAEHLKEEARKVDPKADVRPQTPDPQGVIEWALPAIFLVVAGGVSTAILQEAGKDIYQGLKKIILEAYNEALQSPYEWQAHRREPTLGDSGGGAGDAPAATAPAAEPVTSPPVKLVLEIEGWGGRLTFVFPKDLSPEQVANAYGTIGPTTWTIVDYAAYLYAQLSSKRSRPELYQSSMPDSIWEDHLQYAASDAAALLHGVFIFDAEAGVWGQVN